jgi:predicted lipoprotein with Yx(FWY)xxD motif
MTCAESATCLSRRRGEKADEAMKEIAHRVKLKHRTSRLPVLLTLTAVVGVTGFLASSSVAGDARTNSTVSLGTTKLGMILVNSRRHTLYLFAKDRNGRSACSESCARFWPPLRSTSRRVRQEARAVSPSARDGTPFPRAERRSSGLRPPRPQRPQRPAARPSLPLSPVCLD